MLQKRSEKFDECAVDEAFARPPRLKECIEFFRGRAGALDVDTVRLEARDTELTEASRRRSRDELVERASSLVAPHDAVDVVVAAVVLEERVPEISIIGIFEARLGADPPEMIHLQALRQVGDGGWVPCLPSHDPHI